MIINMERLSREELIDVLGKAIDQISKLVDENKKLNSELKEKLNGTKDL